LFFFCLSLRCDVREILYPTKRDATNISDEKSRILVDECDHHEEEESSSRRKCKRKQRALFFEQKGKREEKRTKKKSRRF
jgi:hypothetical protein